jgi:hypothetical protein
MNRMQKIKVLYFLEGAESYIDRAWGAMDAISLSQDALSKATDLHSRVDVLRRTVCEIKEKEDEDLAT